MGKITTLKPCPFCGQRPKLVTKRQTVHLNTKHTSGQGMKYVKEVKDKQGRTIYHEFVQTKYTVLCPKTDCPAHNRALARTDADEVIDLWNDRVIDREGRWLADQFEYTCTECGYKMSKYVTVSKNYCPECGHKMRGM